MADRCLELFKDHYSRDLARDLLGFFAQGIFIRGSQLEEHLVLPYVGGRVVFPHGIRYCPHAADRKQFNRIPLPGQLVHPELEDPSSSSTKIRGALEEIVEELITNLIFHAAVPDYREYGSRGDPLPTQFARGWRGFYDHEEVGGLVTFIEGCLASFGVSSSGLAW